LVSLSTKKFICRQERRATAYTVPVVVLTFKVIQGRWFSSHLKGSVRFLISDQ